MTLKELEIGDIFYNQRDLSRNLFIVRGNPVFNIRHGSPTRMCTRKGTLVSKSCRIVVVKTGESEFKGKMKLKPINNI